MVSNATSRAGLYIGDAGMTLSTSCDAGRSGDMGPVLDTGSTLDLGQDIRGCQALGHCPIDIPAGFVYPERGSDLPDGEGWAIRIVAGCRHDDVAALSVWFHNGLDDPATGQGGDRLGQAGWADLLGLRINGRDDGLQRE